MNAKRLFSKKTKAYFLQVLLASALSLIIGVTSTGQVFQVSAEGLASNVGDVDTFPGKTITLDVNNTFDDTVDTTTATADVNDPQPMLLNDCNSNLGDHSVWYSFSPEADINLYVDTIGSDYDTLLAIWTESAGNFTLVACNDDVDQFNAGPSKVGFFAQHGTTYHIEVIRYTSPAGSEPTNASGGNLVFHVEEGNFSVTNVYIGGVRKGSYTIPYTSSVPIHFGINGGPVHVEDTDPSNPIFTSQRAYYGSSFNSIVGFPENQLATEYWFTTLDDLGMITYLVIGNPSNTETALVDVYVGGNKMNASSYSIGPGQRVYPRYGINGGPVHVISTNSVPIFASERTKYIDSFNEVMGFPGDQLATDYWFTSLDDLGMITYLVIGNPDTTQTALVDVYIGGNKMNTSPYSIGPGQRIYPRYGVNGGPVHVTSTNGVDIFTSERTKYQNSFNEVMGYPGNRVTTEFWFTTLDDASMITYLVIGNPSSTETALVDVYIGGNKMNASSYSIAPGQRVYPRYGISGGPVRVVSISPDGGVTPATDIFASERSKYLSSFNEILGLPDNELTTDYWFTSLDDVGMSTELIISSP